VAAVARFKVKRSASRSSSLSIIFAVDSSWSGEVVITSRHCWLFCRTASTTYSQTRCRCVTLCISSVHLIGRLFHFVSPAAATGAADDYSGSFRIRRYVSPADSIARYSVCLSDRCPNVHPSPVSIHFPVPARQVAAGTASSFATAVHDS